jgi:DNA mismatch repair protein MutS2
LFLDLGTPTAEPIPFLFVRVNDCVPTGHKVAPSDREVPVAHDAGSSRAAELGTSPDDGYFALVNAHSLEVLEFPAILERLAQSTATPHGAERARKLLPSVDPGEVRQRQELTSEAVALIDHAEEPSLAGIEDVADAAQRAARGASLQIPELSALGRSINVALAAREALRATELAPRLRELTDVVDPKLADVARHIDSCVAEDGSDLRDNASPLLRKLRAELRKGRLRAVEELTRLARSSGVREHLQETFVTERSGRPVLAVKASARSQVPGIVHDASSSGQTLFVEPLAVVEGNNRLAEAAGAEREEVERIVRDLSENVGKASDAIAVLVDATGALDLVFAAAFLSRRWRGVPVELSDEVRLERVRHPLLEESSVVPIDLELGPLCALVISGPNTGGKTVALKTLGLAALLHQSGLRPPAAIAELPVFDQILADIGDEQSIEMSLSTFSGHLRNILDILENATNTSLVLLDELAAGTDPVEGSALAQSLVARLAEQARLTVVTTHYSELKEWASAHEQAANGATGFDPDTYAPLFELTVGRPGTSQALRIAERLGLEGELVAEARRRISPEQSRIAELVADAEAAETAASAALAAAREREAEAAALSESVRQREEALAAELDAVQASAAEARRRAVKAAEEELEQARAELQAFRAELRQARRQERVRQRSLATDTAEGQRDRRLGAATDRISQAANVLGEVKEPLTLSAPLTIGDPVVAPELGVRGTIATIEEGEAEVIGASGLRIRVPLKRLSADPGPHAAPEPHTSVPILAPAAAEVSDQLDVRGTSAQEAREAVRALVDQAALAGLRSVHVVHGRGTGVLRAAVRDELNAHTLVERYESDSADGATVAHLG